MKKQSKSYFNLLISLVALLSSFLFGEVLFNQFIVFDLDNNKWFQQRMLRPYQPPIKIVQQNVNNYFKPNRNPIISYDSLLGWVPTYSFKDSDGVFCHDFEGKRISCLFDSALGDTNALKIAFFGDSYIYGAEVIFEETIGYQLEQILAKHGIKAEVWNYGVGAYGMDQAYLRWMSVANTIRPDIVLFGFQAENASRNTNMIRALYSKKEALPFFKPKFLLQEDLKLINSPTPAPDSLPYYLEHMNQWKWSNEEKFYNPKDYESSLWRASNLFCFFEDLLVENRYTIHGNEKALYNLNNEPARLAIQIISKFKASVLSKGADFYVVNIPRKLDIRSRLKNLQVPYLDLLNQVKKDFTVIDPIEDFLTCAKQDSINMLFKPFQHYSGIGNSIVADKIADKLVLN